MLEESSPPHEDGRFAGKTAIVTGSTRGIGEAIAERLGAEGAKVVVTGLENDSGSAVAERITDSGGTAQFTRTDLRNPDEISDLTDFASELYGSIDIIVNNAAIQSNSSVTETTLSHWEDVIAVNFRAYWLLVREALDKISSGGVVVNVSSNHAHHTMPSEFPYNAVKSGIEGMTRAMAVDLAPLGIRANSVCPGWILVERTRKALSEDDIEQLRRIHPVGRLGRPRDVAGTVSWLVSEDAAFVNGASILLDGGRGAVMQDDVFLESMKEE
jgi:NAD(P)-dependent dehydrogenase (short-subunit alcohol dehydrogenase family)